MDNMLFKKKKKKDGAQYFCMRDFIFVGDFTYDMTSVEDCLQVAKKYFLFVLWATRKNRKN